MRDNYARTYAAPLISTDEYEGYGNNNYVSGRILLHTI
jgi:hypothetical protein